MPNTKPQPKKTAKGGNLSKDIANLSVPFGLILAQKSLEKYLSTEKSKKTAPKKKVESKKPKTRKATA